MRRRPVAITGMGAVAAGGCEPDSIWRSVREGRVNRTTRGYRLGDGTVVAYPVYAAPTIDLRRLVTADGYAWLAEEGLAEDPDFALLAHAAVQALDQAGLPQEERRGVALVVGHENLGVNALIDRILTSPAYAAGRSPVGGAAPWQDYEAYGDAFYRLQSFPYLFYLSKLLGTQGIGFVVNNACATGLYALELGRQLIGSGSAERVLVACSDYAHATEHAWLQKKGFGSASQTLRPFDAERDGSVLGDGAAAILLESARSAASRGVRPKFAYAGASLRQDNWHMTLPDYPAHTYSAVLREAAALAGRNPIDLLVPHGTGSQLWDRYEMEEIARAFPAPPRTTAFKGSIGHTLGANALLESIILLHVMRDGYIPPIVNCSRPDPRLPFPSAAAAQEAVIRRAVKAVPAYGGFHAAAVFESLEEGMKRDAS